MMADRLPPIETDPLGAIRKELIGAAWRQKARAHRRRRMLTVVSTLLLTFVCLAGGAAAIGVELPLIGETLGGLVAGRQDAERESASGEGDPTLPTSPANVAPGPDSISEPLEMPWGSGETLTAAAYLNDEGEVCFLLVRPSGAATAGACTAERFLDQRLESGVAFVQSVVDDRLTVVSGFVAAEVTGVEVRGPEGDLRTRLGEVWRPDAAGISARPFVAVSSSSTDGGASGSLDLQDYAVEAQLTDGRTVTVHP